MMAAGSEETEGRLRFGEVGEPPGGRSLGAGPQTFLRSLSKPAACARTRPKARATAGPEQTTIPASVALSFWAYRLSSGKARPASSWLLLLHRTAPPPAVSEGSSVCVCLFMFLITH